MSGAPYLVIVILKTILVANHFEEALVGVKPEKVIVEDDTAFYIEDSLESVTRSYLEILLTSLFL